MKVALLTPAALSHSVDVYYHHSVIDTVKLCATHGIDVLPISWPGEALVQNARNALVHEALESDADQIFWVDADQEWLPEQFLRLLEHPVDVVGATYPKKQDKEQYTFRAEEVVKQQLGLLAVQACGTGFLRVSRRALQKVWDSSVPYYASPKNEGPQFRMCFDVQVVEGFLLGEDLYFCAALEDAGYQVWMDPSFTVGHNGYKRFKGNVQAWLDRRQPASIPD
jgi:hypothetical protein